MRVLKHHEQKLLKKVKFPSQWNKDSYIHEVTIMRKYHIQNREDYHKYNKLCGAITKLVARLRKLPENDPFRIEMTDKLLEKLYNMGLLKTKKSLAQIDRIAASKFCRRRLPVVLVRLHMAETMKEAVTFVEQGQVRVGPEIITDPAYLVTRGMEDFVTWSDTSKMRRKVMAYNNELDDFDLLG
ncbi:putative U3 small nucleolar ribonucleoprotein IMP3 [Paratrimastix pyriformis]|uniref:U3 small nucleolar ribonucleoprotein IMP3 n=1 Tax=Paratrimastix pyriformis TaxID=342808 RepID=A0ABQ8UEH6_9EUKA|nr:putative U3 small nucleolar ribonucleoprotein IMP3 [Paratrimastix pyriformis]